MLNYTEWGPPDAPPLVFLHGFMGSAADWAAVVERLAGDFRCVALDLPGHGRSLGRAPAAYAFDGAVAAVHETLGELGVERLRLVGYSMGGRMAMAYALRHPRRVGRVVAVSASPGLRTPTERAARAALDEERAQAIETDLSAFLERWYRMPLFAALAARPSLLAATLAARRRNDPAELARALRGLSPARMPSLWHRLDDLGAPTLAVAGADDPRYVGVVHRMAAEGRPVSPLVLPGAGHSVPTEAPERLAPVARHFCRDALLAPQAAVLQAA